MKRTSFAIFIVLLGLSANLWAQTYKLSMPNLVGFPDAIQQGETYNLSVKMFNTGSVRFFVGDKVQMHIKIGDYPAQNIGSEITLTQEIFPINAGTGLLDSLVWEVPNYQFELDKFGGGGTATDIIIWPTVMRTGNLLNPTPDSASKSILYITGAAFRVNNNYISGISGAVQYSGAYMIDVRTENVGIATNTNDVIFYAQIDENESLKTEILRIKDNIKVGATVGNIIQTFKPYLLFSNANLTGMHYLKIFAIEQGLNNMVQQAIYPIISGTFPVILMSFSGQANYMENNIELEWVTEHESSNKEFIVQKLNSLSNSFDDISVVAGKGNNLSNTTYHIADKNPYQGQNHYRLIQKDVDGTSEILETLSVTYQVDAMQLISISPNPASEEIHISLFNGLSAMIQIQLYDSRGVEIFQKKAQYPQGTIDISFDISQLPQGLYYYKVANVYNTYSGSIVKK